MTLQEARKILPTTTPPWRNWKRRYVRLARKDMRRARRIIRAFHDYAEAAKAMKRAKTERGRGRIFHREMKPYFTTMLHADWKLMHELVQLIDPALRAQAQ